MESDPFVTMQVLAALAAQQGAAAPSSRSAIGVRHQAGDHAARAARAGASKPRRAAQRPRRRTRTTSRSPPRRWRRSRRRAPTSRARAEQAARARDRARRLSDRREGARARARREAGPRASAMRDEAARRSAVGDARDRRGRDGDREYAEAERLLLVSNHKTTALALDAIMREAPTHALVTKLARGLLDGAPARPLDARRRRTSSCCRRCAATSTPTRRPRRTTPASCGSAPRRTPSRRSSAAASARGVVAARLDDARAGLDARHRDGEDRARAACTTGSASRTRRSRPNLPRARRRLRRAPQLHAPSTIRRTSSQLADGRWKIKLGARVLVDARGAQHDAALRGRARRSAARRLRVGEHEPRDRASARRRRRRPATGTTPNMRDNRSEAFAMDAARRHAPVLVHRARDDAGHVHRRAGEGRGDVQPRDVRALGRRDRRDRVIRTRARPTASRCGA